MSEDRRLRLGEGEDMMCVCVEGGYLSGVTWVKLGDQGRGMGMGMVVWQEACSARRNPQVAPSFLMLPVD